MDAKGFDFLKVGLDLCGRRLSQGCARTTADMNLFRFHYNFLFLGRVRTTADMNLLCFTIPYFWVVSARLPT